MEKVKGIEFVQLEKFGLQDHCLQHTSRCDGILTLPGKRRVQSGENHE